MILPDSLLHTLLSVVALDLSTGASLTLGPLPTSAPTPGPSTEPPPLELRIRQDRSNFEEQQRLRVAEEARAEKRQKKQVRSLTGHSCDT